MLRSQVSTDPRGLEVLPEVVHLLQNFVISAQKMAMKLVSVDQMFPVNMLG